MSINGRPDRCDWRNLPELPPEWAILGGSDSASASEEPKSKPLAPPPTAGNTVALKRLSGLSRHLAATPKGGRHQALYTIARTLGGLVVSGYLTHDDIHHALHAAADSNGLLAEDGDRNITQTIADGIAKGIDDGPDPGHHEPVEGSAYTLTPRVGEVDDDDDDVPEIDWPTFKYEEFNNARWLIEPIIPAGSSVALYAVGKTGKSLLAFDIVAAAASGRPILGGEPIEPIHILYVDQEMTRREAWDRANDLGYFGPEHEDSLVTLGQHMHYANLYPWPPLDTAAGGAKLLKKARKVKAKLVVIDTLIRTVEGEENSADTIKNFYQHTGMALKEAGISLLRIDHAGKDLTRGQRGTSAKRDDVEVVWFLKKVSELPDRIMLTLVNEASRVDWVQEDIHITRNLEPLAHVVPTVLELTSADIEIVNYLQEQGLWGHNVTGRNARQALNDSPLAAKQVRLAHVVKWMKRYGDPLPEDRVSRRVSPENGNPGIAEGIANPKEENPRSGKGIARVSPTETEKQGEGTNSPLLGGGGYPPEPRRRERPDPMVKTLETVVIPPGHAGKYHTFSYLSYTNRPEGSGRVTDCGKMVTNSWRMFVEDRAWVVDQGWLREHD